MLKSLDGTTTYSLCNHDCNSVRFKLQTMLDIGIILNVLKIEAFSQRSQVS